tara:strand:- start:258 stop:3245 length:2988 start_codon:yes stop_codon:yes gene_type:complete
MISSFVFSLIAFFIVSTTTFIIISNQSKVNNLKNTIKNNKEYVLNSTSKQDKKVLELVNEVNLKHKDLQFENQKTKDEFKKKTTKVDNKINNLDKVFNSYKNITTANFMGMNNRVSKEVSRIDETANKLKKKVNKNEEERKKKDVELLDIINTNETNFNNFRTNTYAKKVSQLGTQDFLLDEKINLINSNLLDAVIDSSNLDYDARNMIRKDVQGKYDKVNKSLNTFFGIDKNYPFVSYYNSVTAETNSSNNFRQWFNSNYNFNDYLHFKSMDQMISLTDVTKTTVDSLNRNVTNLNTSNRIAFEKLDGDTNLYKDNFASFMTSEYNFDVNSLVNIASNAVKIDKLNDNIVSLSNTLNSIGIFDVTVEGSITLENLHQSIQSNQLKIDSNVKLISDKFNKEFGDYLESNITLDNYYSKYLTSNLSEEKLLEKLANTTLETSEFTTNKISLDGDMVLNGNSLSNSLYEKDQRTLTFDNVFNFGGYNYKGNYVESDDAQNKTMMSFINSRDENRNRINGDNYVPRQIRVNPGVNMFLQREKETIQDQGTIGGRLYIDSFDDIGITNRDVYFNLNDEDFDSTKARNLNFKKDDTNTPLTLGNALSNLGKRIEENKNDIQSIQTNNVTKTQLYNTINNNTSLTTDYNTEKNGGGYGLYGDDIQNGFRIDNLYTGGFGGTASCKSPNMDNVKKCKTVNTRLEDLESSTYGDKSSEESNKFNLFMKAYGDTDAEKDYDIGSSGHHKLNLKHDITEVNSLKATENSTIGGDLSVNGDVYFGQGTSKLYLRNGAQDLRKVNSDGGLGDSIFDDYTKKEDGYIKNLQFDLVTNRLLYNQSDSAEAVDSIISLPSSLTITRSSTTTSPYSEIFNINDGSDNSDGNGRDDSKSIYNPKQYSYVTHDTRDPDDHKLTINQIHNGVQDGQTINVPLPSINRGSILDKLADSTPGETIKPYFPTGIKLGNGCIKVESGKLKICDVNCGGCKTVWDHEQAPDPRTVTDSR